MSDAPAGLLLDPSVRRIALLRLRTGMGDLLCTVPALRALRRARPDVRIDLVTWAEMAPVVERMSPWVDELVDFPGLAGVPERAPRPERWDAWVARMRAGRYDVALQAYGANRAANLATRAVGARWTGGFVATQDVAALGGVDLTTHVPYPTHLHEVERHLHLFAALGVPVPAADASDGAAARALELPLTATDRAAAAAVREGAALEPGRYVALHAGATCSSRRWPTSRFAAVAAGLVQRGWRVALTGVRSERDVVDALLDALVDALGDGALTPSGPGVVDLCARTDLGSFAAVTGDAALLVTNDTGAAHVAAALRTPSVVVFLSGDPQRWAAPDVSRHRVVREPVECNPCRHLDCPIDFRCAARILPERVLAACDDVLAATGGAP